MAGDDVMGPGDGRAATLAAFVAAEADDALATFRPRGEAVQLMRAARAREKQRRRTRRAFVGAGAAGTCALVALAVVKLTSPVPAVLSYTVDGATPPSDGYVRSSPAQQPKLAFSDGTDIQMMAKARAHVVEVGRRGARLDLEDGRVHVHVAHRPGADWQVQAGAYVIHVHGTSFFVEWNALAARLDVQMESGVIYGLTAALGNAITIKDGAVEQANFDTYPMLKMADAPEMETHLALSGGKRWGGIGEPATPPIAPAVCNAIFAITGKRIRSLPISDTELTGRT